MQSMNSWATLAGPHLTSEVDSRSPRLSVPTPEQVFHDYAPRVYSLALRMLGHTADAEDATQEVLLQVIRKIGAFRGESAISTWLHRLTVNAALAIRRRQARHPVRPGDHLFEGLPAPAHRYEEGEPHRQALNLELRQHVEGAIACLPDIYRDVFVLADVEGLSNGEICSLLELGLPAVKSRLHRARLLMRDALAPYLRDGVTP